MFIRQHVHEHTEWELLKWMILIALACTLALGVLTSVTGAVDLNKEDREPTPLPSEVADLAVPMEEPRFEKPPAVADLAMSVWQALELQHNQKYDEAIAAWQTIDLSCDTAVWKQVALGQAYLATGEIDSATEVLLAAKDLRTGNPLVHYFLGLLRLEQACVADEWRDAVGLPETTFVAYKSTDAAPHTKSMYQLIAMMELEEAIKLAPDVWADQPLVPTDWPTRAALAPTVGDLLLAVSADNFEAKAHNMLSYLYLDRGSLETAEGHMDSAAAGGLQVIGYSDLGEKYAEAGQPTDAARAYVKAMKHSPNKVEPARKAWDNLRDAWRELW
jgi:tetratricopeptide (TPR) repeat protein